MKCFKCSRRFCSTAAARHIPVCKNKNKKAAATPAPVKPEVKQQPEFSRWREDSKSFREAMANAKAFLRNHACPQPQPLKPYPPPEFTQCPHCLRSFWPKSAERHIPQCEDIGTKPFAPRRPVRLPKWKTKPVAVETAAAVAESPAVPTPLPAPSHHAKWKNNVGLRGIQRMKSNMVIARPLPVSQCACLLLSFG